MGNLRAVLCAAALTAGPTAMAVAAPLTPEACAALKQEYDGLVASGTKSDMDRGPDWAKANLAPERLGKIERLIAVEEQLSFRCGGDLLTARPIIKELPKPEPDTASKDGGKADGAQASMRDGTPSNIPPPKKKKQK